MADNIKHSLTLKFGRILSIDEWREAVAKAKDVPHIQEMEANAVRFCKCGHSEADHQMLPIGDGAEAMTCLKCLPKHAHTDPYEGCSAFRCEAV